MPLVTKDTTGDEFISGQDPASFLGKFVVDLYYGTEVKPQKIDVVVIRNDNKANVKTIKADVTSFPASIQVTGAQLATLFDSTIELGDKFEIGADVTTINGQKFEAFPEAGNPYGADTSALPGSRFSIEYVADCVFDIASFNGWYTVVGNTIGGGDWGDLKVGDGVAVSAGGNEISVFALNTIPSGVAICKDMDYSGFIRKYDGNKTRVMYVPAWDFIRDGWLHSRMAILRGVENGYAIVRTARQGELTISDHKAKVLFEESSTNNKAAGLTGNFPLIATKTIYSQFGDWFGYLIAIIALLFVLTRLRRKTVTNPRN